MAAGTGAGGAFATGEGSGEDEGGACGVPEVFGRSMSWIDPVGLLARIGERGSPGDGVMPDFTPSCDPAKAASAGLVVERLPGVARDGWGAIVAGARATGIGIAGGWAIAGA